METVLVNLGLRGYQIYIGSGILSELGSLCRPLFSSSQAVLVTNPRIGTLYGEEATASLKKAGFRTAILEVPEGEEHKTLEEAARLYDSLLSAQVDRRTPLIALGGGVIGDLAGFTAATYMRGLPFVQVPTSLLAQVDSSVGGKVAVNHPLAKNLIGAFHQPRLVLADLAVLKTLPGRELRAALAEVIKYGVIADRAFFEYLEDKLADILALDGVALQRVVSTSCRIKARIVEEDEREEGFRAVLNFGHTFGHALEALTGFECYRHGEAVAIGMVLAARLSELMGLCPSEEAARIERLLRRAGLTTRAPLPPEMLISSLFYDKKVREGVLHFVLTKGIGHVKVTPIFETEILRGLLAEGQGVNGFYGREG
ncbi:MAG: 3-dehydroquinate synthase [candidate division NC10 bacterium]|nr:3-dehydroquinate synthase [candidate division NC10 bacterium]